MLITMFFLICYLFLLPRVNLTFKELEDHQDKAFFKVRNRLCPIIVFSIHFVMFNKYGLDPNHYQITDTSPVLLLIPMPDSFLKPFSTLLVVAPDPIIGFSLIIILFLIVVYYIDVYIYKYTFFSKKKVSKTHFFYNYLEFLKIIAYCVFVIAVYYVIYVTPGVMSSTFFIKLAYIYIFSYLLYFKD